MTTTHAFVTAISDRLGYLPNPNPCIEIPIGTFGFIHDGQLVEMDNVNVAGPLEVVGPFACGEMVLESSNTALLSSAVEPGAASK